MSIYKTYRVHIDQLAMCKARFVLDTISLCEELLPYYRFTLPLYPLTQYTRNCYSTVNIVFIILSFVGTHYFV